MEDLHPPRTVVGRDPRNRRPSRPLNFFLHCEPLLAGAGALAEKGQGPSGVSPFSWLHGTAPSRKIHGGGTFVSGGGRSVVLFIWEDGAEARGDGV
jgi:hypothetical protein